MDDAATAAGSSDDAAGRYAYRGLERVVHEPARLGLLMVLVAKKEGAIFTELRTLCDLTDGNLNRHVHALEKEGIVEIWKKTSAGRSRTLVRLTDEGRQRFAGYLGELARVLGDARRLGLGTAGKTD